MSEAARIDISIDQGSDFALQLYWTNNYDIPYRVVHPIRMEVRDSTSGLVMEFVSGNETGDYEDLSLSFNTELGVIQLFATADKTSAIAPGVYFYDLFVTYEDDTSFAEVQDGAPSLVLRRMKIMEGLVTVNGKVTQDV